MYQDPKHEIRTSLSLRLDLMDIVDGSCNVYRSGGFCGNLGDLEAGN